MNNRPNWIRVGDRLINLDHVAEVFKAEDFKPVEPGADLPGDKQPCVIIRFAQPGGECYDQRTYFGEDNDRLRFWMDRNFHAEYDLTKYVKRDPEKEG
jgi:hypothetical protein